MDRLFAPMYTPRPERRRRADRRHLRGPAAQRPAARRLGPRSAPDVRLPGRHRDQQRPAAGEHAARPGPAGARAAGAAGQRGELPAGLRVRALAAWPSPRWAATSTGAAAHQRRAVPAARPPRLRDAPLLLLRPRPPRGHRHPAAHLRRGRPRRAAARPPGRHLRLGLAAQLRRRRRRRRPPLPAHPRRGHRGAQAPRAAARPPRPPRLAHRPAELRRAARPARPPGCASRPPVEPDAPTPYAAYGRRPYGPIRTAASGRRRPTSVRLPARGAEALRRLRPPCAHRRPRGRDATTAPRGSRSSSATSTASSRSTTGSGTTRATPSSSRSPGG